MSKEEPATYVSEGADKKFVVEFYPTYTSIHRQGDPMPVVIENDILHAAVSAISQYATDKKPEAPAPPPG